MSSPPDWDEMSLDAIGLHYGTDKASSCHDYLRFYEGFLSRWRQKDLKVIEIGVYDGQSLNVWEKYFPNARIIGCDIKPLSKQYETDRVTIEILDQANVEDLTQLSLKHGPFDLIIEDGSHMHEHQTTSLRTLFPFLKARGIYIVEDLQTNYGRMIPVYRGSASETCVEYLKKWLDLRVADAEIDIAQVEDAFLRTYGRTVDFLTFYRRACLIQKGDGAASNIVRPQTPMMKRVADELEDRATLVAHVSTRGDMMGDRGFVNPVADDKYYEIQGISIATPSNVLEYRVRLASGRWTDWAQEGGFLGTRGQSMFLSGIAVRVTAAWTRRLAVKVIGRFRNGQCLEVEEGVDCALPEYAPLCGVRIILVERRLEGLE